MKRLLVFLFFTLWLFASGRFLSPLPLPKTIFIDLDTQTCDDACLREYLNNDEIFDFLAKARNIQDSELKKIYSQYASLFRVPSTLNKLSFNVEIVATRDLAPYTNKIVKALCAYSLNKGYNFTIENRLVDTPEQLVQTINDTNETDLIVIPLTYYQRSLLERIETKSPLFVPTLHKTLVNSEQKNIYFGGADYFAQLDRLLSFSGNKTYVFYLENSVLSKDLTQFVKENIEDAKLYAVDRYIQNLKPILQNNQEINESTVILNTPMLKTSMILSQLTYFEIAPKYKLSTQINYNPKIFTLTQPKDRANLYLAISFTPLDPHLEASNELYGNHLEYEWLPFSTTVGSQILLSHESETLPMIDRQINYPIKILKTFAYHFESLEEDFENGEGF